MDAKQIGNIIAGLRKASGYTQVTLANKLRVSDKTVSKWESGLGYPEITQFPALASLFGVSIDYLMTGERTGITVAGNMTTDMVKSIARYPEKGQMCPIGEVSRSVGGCAVNTALNLTRLDPSIPVSVAGCVGDDENGRFILHTLQRNRVNSDRVTVTDRAPTAFSDMMNLPDGERTCFYYRGANDVFSPAMMDVDSLRCKLLHCGYLLLMDEFDREDEVYGTQMARFLCRVRERGIRTSIDMTLSNPGKDVTRVLPALPHTDYVIIDEAECCALWGLASHRPDGDTVRRAMEWTLDAGVGEKVVVHSREAAYCLSRDGSFTAVGSLLVEPAHIRGNIGAGDTFAAGCLYGLYTGLDDRRLLEFASAAAASSLFAVNGVDGMGSREDIEKLNQKYRRVTL